MIISDRIRVNRYDGTDRPPHRLPPPPPAANVKPPEREDRPPGKSGETFLPFLAPEKAHTKHHPLPGTPIRSDVRPSPSGFKMAEKLNSADIRYYAGWDYSTFYASRHDSRRNAIPARDRPPLTPGHDVYVRSVFNPHYVSSARSADEIFAAFSGLDFRKHAPLPPPQQPRDTLKTSRNLFF